MDVVGVAWNGSEDDMQAFVDRHGLTFPSIRDERGEVFARFGVPAQPAFVLLGADGQGEVLLGAVDEDLLADRLASVAG